MNNTLYSILAITVFSLSGCSDKWKDKALLHDGRTINVKREMKLKLSDASLNDIVSLTPNHHYIEAINPYTKKTITWTGESNINPIMLDFVHGSAYLVISSWFQNLLINRPLLYGCPDLPYIFLKLDEHNSEWYPLQNKDIPIELKSANLSVFHGYFENYFRDKEWKPLILPEGKTLEELKKSSAQPVYDDLNKNVSIINKWNKKTQDSSENYLQLEIPRNLNEWNYKSKDKYLEDRLHLNEPGYIDNCRINK
ncbi:hypothetical protein [Janthinobacterium sp. B9-8]|uniref:hypothetical protein n=1 Tax=Janthinobacterium sp. B9-8 TaxID=1236179 RepID=UPI00061D3DA2|nr:hypothetical protein [Janthinobacterium sp. B9-8]AMC35356.1 hypothetical protein VN23_12415 [Janthinobacterium sp. B9-8]